MNIFGKNYDYDQDLNFQHKWKADDFDLLASGR